MIQNKINQNEKDLFLKKIINNELKYNNNNLYTNIKPNKKNNSFKKVKIYLPNLSKNKITGIINNISNNKSLEENKDNNINIIDLSTNNEMSMKKHQNLNKSVSFPSLKNIDIKENEYPKKISNFSNINLNKSVIAKVTNDSNQKNIQFIKNKLLPDKLNFFKKSNSCTVKYGESKIKKNNDLSNLNIKYNDTKNMIKSSLQMSKIKINEIMGDKNKTSSKKVKKSLNSKKKSRNHSFLRNDSSIISIPKYSNYFKIAQKKNVTAKEIYKHYLNKSAGVNIRPIRNYKKFFDDKNKNFLEKLSRIYCENKKFLSILKEIKDNKKIAYKDDFNIEEYQSTIVELMDHKISQKYLIDLQNDYRKLNKKFFGFIEPRGRYTLLADKLRYNVPLFLLERFKQMDKDTIINRMNFYNKFKKFKNENKLVSRFIEKQDKNNIINNDSNKINNDINNNIDNNISNNINNILNDENTENNESINELINIENNNN